MVTREFATEYYQWFLLIQTTGAGATIDLTHWDEDGVKKVACPGEYVRRFQLGFAIVSDEDCRQHVGSRQYSTPRQPVSMTSSACLPRRGSASRVPRRRTRLRRLRDESARFNLGRIYRNINYPTLALQYLDPALPA